MMSCSGNSHCKSSMHIFRPRCVNDTIVILNRNHIPNSPLHTAQYCTLHLIVEPKLGDSFSSCSGHS
ncbi:hypothetical protein VTN31DRAFT_6371 [Thermomyces dupontii]|uniref:uncharacterized protein n=1 Tax=Talaromyces thermophilus TaxID=28565 RepID=UPI00374250B9